MSTCCGPGYASPTEAMRGPRERLLYTIAIYTGTGIQKPDYLATIDADPASATFSKVMHRLEMPGIGDELHHMGWNACSSCHHDASMQRRYLVLPGVSAPPLGAALLMVLAGVAWGIYSLLGRGSADPLGETAGNFARAVPFAIVVSLMTIRDVHVRPTGLLLAIASGAVASGLGYVIWYAALRTLHGFAASIVQLAVPVLAAGGGVLLLGERITIRLVLSGVLVLGGIALAIAGRSLLSGRGSSGG